MCKLILKFSTNNIFLTCLLNKKKIYSKSTGQFLSYKKGKKKMKSFHRAYLREFGFEECLSCLNKQLNYSSKPNCLRYARWKLRKKNRA